MDTTIKSAETKKAKPTVAIADTATVSAPDKKPRSPFYEGTFRERLEELITLLSQNERAFILGAGCSKCANLPLTCELTDLVLAKFSEKDTTYKLLKSVKELYGNTSTCTIEDYLSELVDFLSISERRAGKKATKSSIVLGSVDYSAEEVRTGIEKLKTAICEVIQAPERELSDHRKFAKTIHRTLRSGKARSSVDYFVLNYDTLLEDSLALERISYSDGMEGGANAWWNFQLLSDCSHEARVFKVHGSIDWRQVDDDVLPRRLRQGVEVGSGEHPVLIWPATTKYRETQLDPFAQVLQAFCSAVRPSTDAGVVLTILGYSYNDAHINYEIERALRDSGDRINLIAFTSEDEPTGKLKEWIEDGEIGKLIRVHANKGFYHGEIVERSDDALPWWKFEVLIDLLGGKR